MIEYTDDQLSKLSQKQLIDLLKNKISKQKTPEIKKQKLLSKQQLFEDIIKSLEIQTNGFAKGVDVISELIKTGRFTELQARTYLRKACDCGYLYEPQLGFFKRA